MLIVFLLAMCRFPLVTSWHFLTTNCYFQFSCRVEQNIGLDQLCPFAARGASDTHTAAIDCCVYPPVGDALAWLPPTVETLTPARWFTAKTSDFASMRPSAPGSRTALPGLRPGTPARLPHTTGCGPAV